MWLNKWQKEKQVSLLQLCLLFLPPSPLLIFSLELLEAQWVDFKSGLIGLDEKNSSIVSLIGAFFFSQWTFLRILLLLSSPVWNSGTFCAFLSRSIKNKKQIKLSTDLWQNLKKIKCKNVKAVVFKTQGEQFKQSRQGHSWTRHWYPEPWHLTGVTWPKRISPNGSLIYYYLLVIL